MKVPTGNNNIFFKKYIHMYVLLKNKEKIMTNQEDLVVYEEDYFFGPIGEVLIDDEELELYEEFIELIKE